MKGVVLMGGTGSRLAPLTLCVNKHLLPVGKVAMAEHPTRALINAGIDDIMIVTGTEHMGDIVGYFGSGKRFGCHFTYRVQDEAGGIAQAVGLAEDFVGDNAVAVVLGDNIFNFDLSPYVDDFDDGYCVGAIGMSGHIFVKAVSDPQRFGVAEIDHETKKVLSIEEKPSDPKSNLAVIGVYLYTPDVFEVIRTLKPSQRGELEITDVNNYFRAHDALQAHEVGGYWSDAGVFDTYWYANQLVRS